jgi:hypothetical protein
MDRQRIVNIASTIQAACDSMNTKWFLSFGSLLHFVRDRELNLEEDIDIGIIGNAEQAISALSAFVTPTHAVRNDVTGEPFSITFKHEHLGFVLDLFVWKRKDGMLYHAYDHTMTFPANGILSEYQFKGIPAHCFDVDQPTIEMYQKDIRYGRAMTNFGTWKHAVPQIEEEGIELCLPFFYGACLDHWYSEWLTKRPQFGVSLAAHTFTTKSCAGIQWEA